MGSVYRAIDELTGDAVALKLLHAGVPDGELRFAREAAALARMSHPSVVRYVAHGMAESGPFVAMEWLEGEDLARRLRRRASPSPRRSSSAAASPGRWATRTRRGSCIAT